MTVNYIVGDTREAVAGIPDRKVSLVTCSPPFIALRSYLPADHPDKDKEIGSEPDPATFLDTLLGLTAEWGRVLAPWGSIAIELGDTYAGGSAQGTDQGGSVKYPNGRGQDGLLNLHTKSDGNWPRPKCLALVPQLYAASLAYGRNILTGQPSPAGQWLVRNVIVWHRPNPAVGALGDKYRPSTSYITVATRSPKRWFDLTAVRGAPSSGKAGEVLATSRSVKGYRGITDGATDGPSLVSHPAGAPPLDTWFDQHDSDAHDTWTMTTQPSSLAHYAMWPAKLAERPILSMCPAQVCNVCGEPRRRIESATYRSHGTNVEGEHAATRAIAASGSTILGMDASFTHGRADKIVETLGWSDCGCLRDDGRGGLCNDYRPGVVLDPFCGTGTTLCAAELHGRDSIGIDIDARNRELLDRRMVEVKRNLFGTVAEMPGQESLFGDASSAAAS